MDKKTFGETIKLMMKRNGIKTIKEWVMLSGIDEHTVGNIVRGKNYPLFPTFYTLMDSLNHERVHELMAFAILASVEGTREYTILRGGGGA